ncbi:MFS transporter [Falsiroseomonas oryziterrae]|uniref:MFS transporter n=1 Tax=Falsiroseomonas oryziterrae TaxID=2911368 RepID=UPI001F3260A6|nr:MFS transporter [Roseomonas sp. NPKOSM-4]
MAMAAFTVGCGMRMLDPLLPMMARDFGVGLGAVAKLIAGFSLAYGLGQLLAGPVGDALGKLRVAAVAMALYAGTLFAAAQAPDLGGLLAFRIAAGLAAAATIPLFMAHIGDTTPYAQRQATLGRFLTGMVMAQLLAGPIAGIVGDLAGWRAVFLVLGAVAGAITLVFAWRIGPAWRVAGRGRAGLSFAGFLELFRRKRPRMLMLVAAADGFLLFGGVLPFLGSLLIEGFGRSATEAGIIAAGFGLGSLLYTRAAPWLVARLGERRLVLLGGLGMAAAFAVIGLAPAWWVVAAAIAPLGLLFFMLHGVLQARATEALPEARGTAVAGFAMSLFMGQSLGAIAFGTLIGGAGFAAGFLVAAVGIVALAVAIRRWVIPSR